MADIVILQDTIWTGTVDITGKTVQVAEGVKLTISQGTTVNGGNIDVWGSLIVDGKADALVNFNKVHINSGSTDTTKLANIDILP